MSIPALPVHTLQLLKERELSAKNSFPKFADYFRQLSKLVLDGDK